MSGFGVVNIQRRAGFLLATLGRRAERAWYRHLNTHGLTTSTYSALSVLVDGEQTQRDLAAAMGIDARNAGAITKALHRSGWVTSRPSPTDGRARLLTASEEGRARWHAAQAELARDRARCFAPLSPDEVAALEQVLNRLNDHHLGSGASLPPRPIPG